LSICIDVVYSLYVCFPSTAVRTNEIDNKFEPEPINDVEAATAFDVMTRQEEKDLVQHRRDGSLSDLAEDPVFQSIQESMEDYSKLYASQQLAQQEVDVYTDRLDLYHEGFASAADMLGPPDETQMNCKHHTVEGMTYSLVGNVTELDDETPQEPNALVTLAAAGEAAVNGVMMQAVADSAPLQDDYAYYINDGVYGAFNNLMFDHASVRPRVLHITEQSSGITNERGFKRLDSNGSESSDEMSPRAELFASTVFGPTCDSIDVVARSVLLPKLKVGDFLYMNNMGAYTMAAASSFNGFTPTEKLYVCSVQPEYFEAMIKGPADAQEDHDWSAYGAEEKKEID
jgi:Pyridoxal-dependent decarboxylase, C-terminal sheet domain